MTRVGGLHEDDSDRDDLDGGRRRHAAGRGFAGWGRRRVAVTRRERPRRPARHHGARGGRARHRGLRHRGRAQDDSLDRPGRLRATLLPTRGAGRPPLAHRHSRQPGFPDAGARARLRRRRDRGAQGAVPQRARPGRSAAHASSGRADRARPDERGRRRAARAGPRPASGHRADGRPCPGGEAHDAATAIQQAVKAFGSGRAR